MAQGTRAAIAADAPDTVQAGVVLAEAGGNAVDIAVGAALAACLAESLMGSLGGSGFLMLQSPGRPPELIEGADSMPAAAHPGGDSSREVWDVALPYGDGITVRAGPASIAVPGLLAALELAWRRHGSLPWREITAPAQALARDGFPLGRTTAAWLAIAGEALFARQAASRECFCPDPASPPSAGTWFRIPDIASSLELIAAEGARAFYEGELASCFAAAMEDLGGLVSRKDLAAYRAVVRRPLRLVSRGFSLALNPPPAIGGVALGSLVRLQELEDEGPCTDADRARRLMRAQLALFGLRREAHGHSRLSQKQASALLKHDHLRRHLKAVGSPNTTHLSVTTACGAQVAITLSNGYGSGITIPGTGIACNNSLGEPELNPAGYLAAPGGSRLVSNMAPTLVRHPDGRRYAMGSPGASRITTALAQMWHHHTEGGLNLEEAMDAPRLHVNAEATPPLLLCEPGIDSHLVEEEMAVHRFSGPDMYFGGVKLTGLEGEGRLRALADRRRQGSIALTG